MQPPTLDDVAGARARVYAHMRPSPLLHHPLLDEWIGCRVWVKHENHNPTGSFKIRGGLNLVAQLDEGERQRGVVAASTGNHGQSLALACQLHGVRCRIVVPVGANPDKMAAMRAFGTELEEHGRDFDEAREWVEAFARREGWRYVHNAFARSWRGPERVTSERAETFAEGIATRTTFDLTFSMLKTSMDDVVTLQEDELREGVTAAIQYTHNLAEGAGGAPLAAARQFRPPRDATIVCVMSGGNADLRTLRHSLA